MHVRLRWLAGAAYLALASIASATSASDRSDRPALAADSSLALGNGVTVWSDCAHGNPAAPGQHITFSARSSHSFLGYGVAIETGRAAADIPQTIDILKKLGFAWVKLAVARADKSEDGVTDQTQSDAGAASPLRVDVDMPPANKKLFDSLRAAGIKIVDTIHHPPGMFFDTTSVKKGRHGRRVKPDALAALAQYYTAYLRAMFARSVRPDLIELVNEPNLRQGGRYTPEEYARLLKAVEAGLGQPGDANLSGPGTATHVPIGLSFVRALDAQGALAPLKAITLHTYYVRDRPNNDGIPPADDPALQSLFATAKRLGVPLISTEFGGTDIKTKLTDPGRESVDTAEEFKAALDLIRQGESAAIVWNLYPNDKNGSVLKTWALVDATGPTNAYWPFDILSRRIPVGSDVLAVEKSDVPPTMTSLGYAAFRSGRHIYVGLSNPAPVQPPTTVALNLSRLGASSLAHIASFLPDRSIGLDSHIRAGECPVDVTMPSGTGAVLDFEQSQ